MASVHATTPRVQPEPLTIKGMPYAVSPIDPGPDGTAAYRLVKLGGNDAVYDVIRTHFGLLECSCPHYELRLKGNTCQPCKHGGALVDAGLMAAPAWDAGPRLAEPPAAWKGVPDEFDEPAPACSAPSEPAPCKACVGSPAEAILPADHEPSAEDWADFGEWATEIDARLWDERIDADGPGPFEPLLPFADWLTVQAQLYRMHGTTAASWLAARLDALVEQARFLDAAGPEQFDDRLAAHLDAVAS